MALNRSQWRKLINVGIESSVISRVRNAAYRRSVCNGEQRSAPDPQNHHVNCVNMWKTVSHSLVLKAICENVSKLLQCIMAFMWAKATDNAQSVVKFATIWQAWKVVCECIKCEKRKKKVCGVKRMESQNSIGGHTWNQEDSLYKKRIQHSILYKSWYNLKPKQPT